MSHDERMRSIYADELPTRVDRPLPDYRVTLLEEFVATARGRGLTSVVEVGCGAGRDGVRLRDGGLAYVGTDLSPVGVRLCLGLGLNAVEASAVSLPFADGSFGCAWSMSTLMHLPGEEMATALAELARIVRPGGLVEVGVWGATETRDMTDEAGRYFRLRADDEVMSLLDAVGSLEEFRVVKEHPDGGRYQWGRLRVG